MNIFNKKADISARKMIFYGVSSFVIIIGFLLLVLVIPQNKSGIGKIPPGVESYLLEQRFLNSPLCFAFQDEDSRIHQGIIDLKKFNQETLNECYSAEDTKVKAYKLTLDYNNEKINTKNWEGFLKKAETKHVSVYDNGEIKRAELLIEMQDVK